MTSLPLLRYVFKDPRPYAFLCVYDASLNVKQLVPVMQSSMTPYDFVYSAPKLDDNGNPIVDDAGRLEYVEKLAKYTRPFIVAQKAGADKYFFLQEGRDTCDDPSDLYVEYHFGGSLVGHAIEVMARLAQIKRDTMPGFSIGKHWFLLLAVLMATLVIGIFVNGYITRMGY